MMQLVPKCFHGVPRKSDSTADGEVKFSSTNASHFVNGVCHFLEIW